MYTLAFRNVIIWKIKHLVKFGKNNIELKD